MFKIKQTGVPNRKPPIGLSDLQMQRWQENRNLQINLDTILQVISLRGQPENISDITTEKINFREFDKFGFLFDGEEDQTVYYFDFTVFQKNVFDDGETSLGALYSDCEDVPMIKFEDDWDKLSSILETKPELKNIYFEVVAND